ncbi:Mannose-6-phosphate isomerase [Acidimicrobium ferrooxidans DSM 10331]|uniref:Mannose-6-phosphate isomerase n=1 Tax=Acidimicrobium ferrooxidans (strain DSM 10331 / JCM 15462 / NBRC 103882 / ICP) TaxID=525909 RepID=C7M132_ACIFD|nr:bifunctional phosphoglucose/phosphomannose isomerase [Acidimicrobium ferrooxidans]ACU54680.1 Mannose-6-phosphate isomerase [Acidimicrobium ferrooxidans DSM 10331]
MDELGMWDATLGLPEQMEAALGTVGRLCDLPAPDQVEHVVVLGMGGSGIAGDVAVATAAPYMPIPVVVVKGYELPSFVGPRSLAVALSFSGNTEETLEVLAGALDHGARAVAISAGGELARVAAERGVCHVAIDGSIPQPRAALGALTVSLLGVLERVGFFPGASAWIGHAIERLRQRRDELEKGTLASDLASALVGTIPIVLGSGAVGQVAALRWKNQINENAKALAVASVLPEAGHNELTAFEAYPELLASTVSLVFLRHDGEHPQISRRVAFMEREIAPRVHRAVSVHGQGVGELATFFDLAFVGDVMSLRLAEALGTDPGPIPMLNALKQYLSGPAA